MNGGIEKEADLTFNLQFLCPWFNELPTLCLIFMNNLRAHSYLFNTGDESSHFLFLLVLHAIYPSRNRATLFILWCVRFDHSAFEQRR